MALLFKKVESLEKENKDMRKQLMYNNNTVIYGDNNIHNIETQNIANHNNTTFNFTLINFGEGQDEIIKILTHEIYKLGLESKKDIPLIRQVQDRILGLVMKVHRNPEQKELQNIYVTDPKMDKDNAFVYENEKWKVTDWSKLNKIVLNNLYNNLSRSNLVRKEDKLEVMKHIFVQGGCGDITTVEKMSDNDVATMYLDIGRRLNFKTIAL